ncbi:MAG: hypothetical protein KDD22_07875, partial [Bdellovibrionales bacterium]|nr:hypothetical protein [Bdellovibrionales bacterium]
MFVAKLQVVEIGDELSSFEVNTEKWVSLGYLLGHDQFSEEEQFNNYGILEGRAQRGDNLKITLSWTYDLPEEYAKLCKEVHAALGAWDHQFLKGVDAPWTFENGTLDLANGLERDLQVSWSRLQVARSHWSFVVEKDFLPEGLEVLRRGRLQTSVFHGGCVIPLDFEIHCGWRGPVRRDVGLIRPWRELKQHFQS